MRRDKHHREQLTLWGNDVSVKPIDPNIDERDVPRVTGQALAILERLREGPATNHELASMSLKYSGRVSDLRAAGYEINAKRMSGGVWVYRLDESSCRPR